MAKTNDRHDEMREQEQKEELNKVTGHAQEAWQQGVQAWTGTSQRAFQVWMQTSSAVLEQALAVNRELVDWSREQLEDSVATARSLATCRSMGDAYGMQIGLLGTSLERSLKRGGTVVEVASRAMTAGLARVASTAPDHTRARHTD